MVVGVNGAIPNGRTKPGQQAMMDIWMMERGMEVPRQVDEGSKQLPPHLIACFVPSTPGVIGSSHKFSSPSACWQGPGGEG